VVVTIVEIAPTAAHVVVLAHEMARSTTFVVDDSRLQVVPPFEVPVTTPPAPTAWQTVTLGQVIPNRFADVPEACGVQVPPPLLL
jgi:hypothetical protein